jgi:hypothetical protein
MDRESKNNLKVRKTLMMMMMRVSWTCPGYQILTKCIPRRIRMLKTLIGIKCLMPEEAAMVMVMMTVLMMVMIPAQKRRMIRIMCKK